MNRLISLIPVGIALAAVGLAQPAQAQWAISPLYYSSGNTPPSSTTGTTVTNTPPGHINITSGPPATYGTFITSGSYSGSVNVDYTWTGGTNTNGTSFATTKNLESTGAGNGSGDSNAGGQQAYGDFSKYPGGWDQKAPQTSAIYYFGPGVPPTKTTINVSFSAHTSVYYNSPRQSATIVTADVTFGLSQ